MAGFFLGSFPSDELTPTPLDLIFMQVEFSNNLCKIPA